VDGTACKPLSAAAGPGVCVDGRRRNISMPEQFLDHPKVTIVLKQMSCEAMPKQVRVNALTEAGQRRELDHKLPDP
jgi:hypothetical protein